MSLCQVETIGDAYMACSGVVNVHPKHTHDLVDCALEFQIATRNFYTPDEQKIVVRIGIHTGFVIAGVVGRKMPRYVSLDSLFRELIRWFRSICLEKL